MLHEKFQQLPDAMDEKDVLDAFDEILSAAKSREFDREDVAQALYEMADRFWHTYQILPAPYRQQIEDWIATNWTLESDYFVDTIAVVIGTLGLRNSLVLIEQSALRDDISGKMRSKLLALVSELKPTIHDPYSGMKLS
jgi:hypothetical protein